MMSKLADMLASMTSIVDRPATSAERLLLASSSFLASPCLVDAIAQSCPKTLMRTAGVFQKSRASVHFLRGAQMLPAPPKTHPVGRAAPAEASEAVPGRPRASALVVNNFDSWKDGRGRRAEAASPP